MNNQYDKNGVSITPSAFSKGDTAVVEYNGLLYNSGADKVYLHLGYNNNWNHSNKIRMRRNGDGFRAEIQVVTGQPLNIAFRDSANNWDNNSGNNYSFEVQ